MAKRSRHKTKQPPRRFPWLLLAAGGVVLLVAGVLALRTPSSSAPAVAPEVTGSPRLAVDQTVVDEGLVKLDTIVRTSYRLRNVGDQPLHILGEPQVELVEGC